MELTCRFLIEQLRRRMNEDVGIAARAGQAAKDAAQSSVTALEKKQDSRTMIEQGNLAYAQARRVDQGRAAIDILDRMLSRPMLVPGPNPAVKLGAIVDAITEDEDGEYGRTFVMLPVGAGEELHGPGGDGLITVVTPQSPVGRAMMGKVGGDAIDVVVKGETIEWEIIEVA